MDFDPLDLGKLQAVEADFVSRVQTALVPALDTALTKRINQLEEAGGNLLLGLAALLQAQDGWTLTVDTTLGGIPLKGTIRLNKPKP